MITTQSTALSGEQFMLEPSGGGHVSGQDYGKNARFQRINRFRRLRPVSGRPVCGFGHMRLVETNTPVLSTRL